MDTNQVDSLFSKEHTAAAVPDIFRTKINETLGALPDLPEAGLRGYRKHMKRALVSAAAVVLVGGAILSNQPAMADFVKSLFNASRDAGLENSLQQGLVQYPNVQAKDKGITLTVSEVMADRSRLVLAVGAENKKGESLVDEVDWDRLEVQDEHGKVVADRRYIQGNVFTYVFPEKLTSETLTVTGAFTEIGSFATRIEGNWNIRFDVNLAHADQQTKTVPINQEYVAPQGYKIEVNNLTKAPSAARLDLTVSLLDKGQIFDAEQFKRNQALMSHELMFHFEDKQGKPISYVNPQELPAVVHQFTGDSYFDEATGKMHLSYIFSPQLFDDKIFDQTGMRLVLDGCVLPVKSGKSLTFKPEEAMRKPVIFEDNEGKFTISDVRLDGQGARMKLTGNVYYRPTSGEWSVVDDQGRQYPVEFIGGGISDINQVLLDASLVIKGMSEIPSEMTLTHKVANKLYSDQNWSFELPQNEG
ncbi:DUF4179 domain-containing protein [Paenibacillus elgii]|uniref:DUF4179 domain-containing protein n=1 Tax=Paenibacillus elgii TaxID=189691 RepID=UPI000FD6A4F9|nr:DUF4179 domain-containing protein [Paenibacillus elgii]NEN84066.1 DUF4179 domain-containing protein [Paenibacillus elgii]